jgi:hypothetical protein
VPPTATPVLPTATPVPPTATPVPPTATPVLPTATPVPPLLTAPTALTAAASSASQVNLTWEYNGNSDPNFQIERCTGAVCTNFAQIATVAGGSDTRYSNTGLSANTTYTYRVRAYNSVGNSAYTNTAAATTSGSAPAPAAPSALSATAVSASQINLTWSDNSNNETGFSIERCTGTGCTNFTQIATAVAGVASYSSTGLTASTAYTYRVRAYNGAVYSAYSNTAAATTLPPAPVPLPAAPSALTATAASSSQINLAWTDNSTNETGFKIESCTGAGCTNFAQIATTGAGVASYNNTGLAANTTYAYRVRAYNATGDSAYSDPVSATTPVAPAQSMHVSDLDGSSESNNDTWTATITIRVHTSVHAALSGVTVTAVWSNGTTGSASCTTNTSGNCTVTKSGLSATVGQVTLTATNLTKTGWTYTPGENHDPDGDSNGTIYVASRPPS